MAPNPLDRDLVEESRELPIATLEHQAGRALDELKRAGLADVVIDLEATLRARLVELDGVDPGRAIRAGRGLAKISAAFRGAGSTSTDDPTEEANLPELRRRLGLELADAIAHPPSDTTVLEDAKRIRDLAEAYVRLGGDLALGELPPPVLPPALDPVDAEVVDRVSQSAWKAANTAGATTAIADAVADAVRLELVSEATR